ncbi:MAG: ABC transporter substrate-binding protein, partial [bacterium]|nr:ABC transporter substrate-binding protein [bacterium]
MEEEDDILFGIVNSSNFPSLFLEGVEFAVNEINQRGGVLGRKLETRIYDDKGDDNRGWEIAKELADNVEVTAVVGHLSSSVAISASIVYEKAELLFLSPWSMDPLLTLSGGDFTFRNIPSGREAGKQAATFDYRQGIKKVVVFYQREDTYKRFMENFNAQAGNHGIEIVTTRSFFTGEYDFRPILSQLKKQYTFDGIFIIGNLPTAGTLIQQIRDVGIDARILGSTDLDSPTLWTFAGRAAEGVVVMTVFDSEQPFRLTREFVARFYDRYGVQPDAWAAQGCDAVQVLVDAMERSGSTVPIIIGSTLRFTEDWEGVTGTYSFTLDGGISGKPFFFKIARNGSFELLERDRIEEAKVDPFYVDKNTTLRIALPHELDTINPGQAETALSAEIIEQLFLGLTSLDPETYQAVPSLAESWTISEDGTVYRFRLRQDVTWTNGLPVTAHDVVQTIQHNIDPETNSPAASLLYVLKNAEAIHTGKFHDTTAIGVRVLDYFTVEFTLDKPAVYFPTLLNAGVFRPLPLSAIEEYGDTWTEPERIQTNGAYRLAAWEKGNVVILRKNPHYYNVEQVSIPEIRYHIVHSPSVGMAMYLQDEIDILGGSYLPVPPNEIPRIKNHPVLHQEYSNPPRFETVAYSFNTTRPPVDDVLVRKAIAAVIEKQMLVKFGTQGDKVPATTFTPPSILGADIAGEKEIGIKFDPLQAKIWLAEAGYSDGKDFPEITLAVYPEYRFIAYPVKNFLKHYLNINVTLQEVSFEEYERLLEQSSLPHMFVFPWFADYPDANS